MTRITENLQTPYEARDWSAKESKSVSFDTGLEQNTRDNCLFTYSE